MFSFGRGMPFLDFTSSVLTEHYKFEYLSILSQDMLSEAQRQRPGGGNASEIHTKILCSEIVRNTSSIGSCKVRLENLKMKNLKNERYLQNIWRNMKERYSTCVRKGFRNIPEMHSSPHVRSKQDLSQKFKCFDWTEWHTHIMTS